MNLKYDLEQLLPDELEKLSQFIDSLFDNKINKRLTNQEYQKNNLDIKCPCCGLNFFKKNGHKNGTQRYLCKNCNKSFSITTNTILSHSKIKYWQLKEFIKCLLDIKSISEISQQVKLSKTQTYYLEIKLFKALENVYNSIKLKGIVQADEKYFRISFKGTKHEKMLRKTRHSGSQDLKVGINKELACVVVAIDENDNIIIEVIGNGPASTEMLEKGLGGKIEENSILVTDSKSSYIKFAQNNNLILKQIPDGEYTTEEIYNLAEVNELILELDNYITHMKRGVSTKHLQQHCNFVKYRKILKYTVEYLERNEKLYKDAIILYSKVTNRSISNIELPFDITGIFDD